MLYNKLKKKDEYASVFISGKCFKLSSVVIQHNERKNSELFNEPRYGIIASKKIGNSAKRNYAKRRLRTLIDKIACYGEKNSDYIFVAKKKLLSEKFSILILDLKNGLNKIKEKNNE